MGKRGRNRRNRERKSKSTIFRAEWHFAGRLAVVVEITRRGEVQLTVPHPERVGCVGREIAADWLAEFLTRLSHEERYAILWGDSCD